MIDMSKRLNRSLHGNLLVNLFLTVMGLFMFLPLLYTLISSFKPLNEFWYFPPRFFYVENPTTRNYVDLFVAISGSLVPFSRYLFNTLMVSVVGTTGHVVFASMCAYILSKHDFPGKSILFRIIVLSLMFSTTVTAIPNFMIMTYLHLTDTYWALILPAFGSPLGLYLMKQFMESMIANELIESARIDGATEWRILWGIVMPIVKPAWLTLIIFSFSGLWNIGGSVLIRSEELKTLNYAMSQILAGGIARAGVGAAAAVIMLIVPITTFIVTQSNIIETMGTSGMKG